MGPSSKPAGGRVELIRHLEEAPADGGARLAEGARALHSSRILEIAAEVHAARRSGAVVHDLTLGDFAPAEFPISRALTGDLVAAIEGGETSYPPPRGLESLRRSICRFAAKGFLVEYPENCVLVTAGARPAIYSFYRTVVEAGEKVVYGVPSWNNNFYCQIVGAESVPVECRAEDGFLPTAKLLEGPIRGARVLALNSPLNPTGTAFSARQLGDICDVVLAENARRGPGERPLFVLFDAVYWMLMTGDKPHVDPVALRPAMHQYTVVVDAISKTWAATGLRVGWALGPADVIGAMGNLNTHVGGWAPRPEQHATALVLSNEEAVMANWGRMRELIRVRIAGLHALVTALQAEGHAVECLTPEGGIYMSVCFRVFGRTTPGGVRLETNEQIRRYFLEAAGVAMVPFDAFDQPGNSGWFRLSVGAIAEGAAAEIGPRLRGAIQQLA